MATAACSPPSLPVSPPEASGGAETISGGFGADSGAGEGAGDGGGSVHTSGEAVGDAEADGAAEAPALPATLSISTAFRFFCCLIGLASPWYCWHAMAADEPICRLSGGTAPGTTSPGITGPGIVGPGITGPGIIATGIVAAVPGIPGSLSNCAGGTTIGRLGSL